MFTLTEIPERHVTINPQDPLGCLVETCRAEDGSLVILGEISGTESTLSITSRTDAA